MFTCGWLYSYVVSRLALGILGFALRAGFLAAQGLVWAWFAGVLIGLCGLPDRGFRCSDCLGVRLFGVAEFVVGCYLLLDD